MLGGMSLAILPLTWFSKTCTDNEHSYEQLQSVVCWHLSAP